MSLLDTLTGGSNRKASEALKRAQENFAGIEVPTAAQLSLPELEKYVQAGILTPAQAKAALQSGNAYNDIKIDPLARESQQKVLGQLAEVSGESGMTPQMQARLTAALDQVQTQEQGANASVLDLMAQRGIPTSLMGTAAQLANNAQQSRSANLAATQAAGQAEQNAIQAMMNEGNLASSMQGQQYKEAADRAAAENAMQQWNAGATNSMAESNANRLQSGNEYNTTNKQNISNANTGTSNQRTQYNAQVPETIFNNKIQKAQGQAGVAGNQANQAMEAGNQQMGLYGALIGGGATMFAADGAIVPGEANVPGDSPANDTVPARLSPGEVVVPRSIASDPEAVKRFVQNLAYGGKVSRPAHPDDVRSVLDALSSRRGE